MSGWRKKRPCSNEKDRYVEIVGLQEISSFIKEKKQLSAAVPDSEVSPHGAEEIVVDETEGIDWHRYEQI